MAGLVAKSSVLQNHFRDEVWVNDYRMVDVVLSRKVRDGSGFGLGLGRREKKAIKLHIKRRT